MKKETSGQEHSVTILVNNKAVQVMGPKATGTEIKQAAINAGLSVGLDFILSHEHPSGDLARVGDHDVLTVNPQSRFSMVSPDHVS